MYTATGDATKTSGVRSITLPVYTMLILTLIGIADAAYVAHANYTGARLWCPILDGCNAVINSPYSRVFGTPMSYFGFIYYLFMFGLAARLAYEPFSNSLRFRAILYAALGAVFFGLFFVPSARLYSRSMQLLSYLCGNVISSSLRHVLAFSNDTPRDNKMKN